MMVLLLRPTLPPVSVPKLLMEPPPRPLLLLPPLLRGLEPPNVASPPRLFVDKQEEKESLDEEE